MAFVCSITGEVPENPVISLVSKNVFERTILEKYIQTNGKDPITNEPMTLNDIIQVKSANIAPPKHSNQNSIPSILKALQDEWDAFVLENYERSKALHSVREELSVSLFHLDSACRVIANLMKENEQLKQTLSQMGSNVELNTPMEIDDQQASANQETEDNKLPRELFDQIFTKSSDLTAERKRKNKSLPPDLVDSTYLSSLVCSYTKNNLHGGPNPGILAMDLRASDSFVVTGSNDKTAVLFDRNSDSVITTFKGHKKRVTHAIFHPAEPYVLTGSADCQVRLWKENVPKAASIMKFHSSPISGVSVHPTNNHILTSAQDNFWIFTDLQTSKPVVKHQLNDAGITCSQIHPDGLIFAMGSKEGILHLFDFKDCSNVVNFTGHSGSLNAIAFSENGYYLSSISEDNSLRIWDLRKAKCINQIDFDAEQQLTCVSFDETGQYLAVGGNFIDVYSSKKWEKVATYNDYAEKVTSVKFGPCSKYIVSSSLDHNLRVYMPS